jgi:arylsulfatase A-like enzyme/Flp pilus assembly protein TadD
VKRPLLALTMMLAGCGPAPAPPAKPANILIVTIDTLRADRVGPALTPSIERVASRGLRFTTARSVVPLTLPSHATIMTGQIPPQNGVHLNGVRLGADRVTLAELFHDAGYRTGAFVGAYVLNRRFGLGQGFDTYDDRVTRDPSGDARFEAERRGDAVVDAALAWLQRSDDRPFFAWIHLYDPHAPYEPPEEYLRKAGGRAYEGEIAFADAQVGRVLDWLQAAGTVDSTVVVVSGDHGEGLGDHGEQTHGMLLYDSTLRVPLVLAAPGIAPGAVDEPVSVVQVAASVLQLANRRPPDGMAPALPRIPQPAQAAGVDPRGARVQRPDLYAETEYPAAAGWHPLAALVDGSMKLIVAGGTELYDEAADPVETRDASASRPSMVEAMRRRIGELARAPQAARAPSADAAEGLRALGYVSGGLLPTSDNAPNPAAHIAAWNSFETELTKLAAGDAKGALTGLARLAGANPDAVVFQSTYARGLKETGRVSESFDLYRRLVSKWPRDAALYHDLGVAAAAAGNLAEAIRAERAALALDPANAAASNGLGLALVARGDAAGAQTSFERAVRDDPSNAVFWTNLGNARREAGNVGDAETAYRSALEADPRSADAANGIGVLLVQTGKAAAAIAWFDRALAGSPGFVQARLNLGIAYQQSGKIDQAIETYRRLVKETAPDTREHRAAQELLRQIDKR